MKIPSILSRWVNRNAKPTMPAFDGPLRVSEQVLDNGAGLGVATVEALVMRDHEALVGRVVFLSEVECYDARHDLNPVQCDPPAVGRIVATDRESLLRWMDDDVIDPIHEVEILEPHPAFAEVSPSYVYGSSRHVGGAVEPGRFLVADETFQRYYAKRPALDGRTLGACAPEVPEESPSPRA